MKRTMIASVLSLALAATSFTAAPARADEDVFKVIAGLVVLGALVNRANKDRERKATTVTRGHGGHVNRVPRVVNPHVLKPRVHKPRRAKVAPRQCLRDQWTHRGERQVYGARCMQRRANAQLPHNCLRQAGNRNGPRYFYTARCLKNAGWRL